MVEIFLILKGNKIMKLFNYVLALNILGFSLTTNGTEAPEFQKGQILTGKSTTTSTIWVDDMVNLIEFFFEDSDSKRSVISGLREVDRQGKIV